MPKHGAMNFEKSLVTSKLFKYQDLTLFPKEAYAEPKF